MTFISPVTLVDRMIYNASQSSVLRAMRRTNVFLSTINFRSRKSYFTTKSRIDKKKFKINLLEQSVGTRITSENKYLPR